MLTALHILILFAGIIFLGFFAEQVFKKTRIPDVIFLIIAGILLSSVFGLINPNSLGIGSTIFVTIALILLLFQGAINLDFKVLFASLRGASALTVVSFFLTCAVITGLSMLIFKFPFQLALLFGMALGGTSSAVVIPLVTNLPLKKETQSVLTIESAISDVFCIVGSLTVISIMTSGQFSSAGVVSSVVGSFAIALFLGFLFGFFWILAMSKYQSLQNADMVTVAAITLLYAIVESPYIGASGAISVLAFGLMLGNARSLLILMSSKKNKTADQEAPVQRNVMSHSSKNFYEEISFFVKVFFFVYLGMLIDFSQPIIFLWSAIITLAVFLVRPMAVKLVFWKTTTLSSLDSTALEVLIPKGLAAAVIAGIALERAVPGAESIINPILGVVFASIIFTAILIFLNGRGKYNGFHSLLVATRNLISKNSSGATTVRSVNHNSSQQ